MKVGSFVFALAAFMLLFVVPLPAFANVGAPWAGGQLAGEPIGIADVAITREQLVIDLRPLVARGLVAVSATYQLDNRSTDKHLDLLFASGASDLKNVRVTLDGNPVAIRSGSDIAVPTAWRAPDRTPRPHGEGTLPYVIQPQDDSGSFGLRLDLAYGTHQLAITYSADAATQHIDEPTVARQFAYVLAPARTWDGFGGLDVTVHVPPGWHAASAPALARDGDVLRGAFPDLPSEAISLAVQAPANAFYVVRIAALAALAFVTICGAIFVARRARSRARSGNASGALVWAAALGSGPRGKAAAERCARARNAENRLGVRSRTGRFRLGFL